MQARVLIVDDEPASRLQVQRILGREGCQTDVAEDSKAALQALRKQTYDLIITDLCMPDMDGVTLVRQVREHQPDVAALLMTAWPWDARARAADIDVLVKPFTRQALRDSMHLALSCPVPRCALDDERSAPRPEAGTRLILREHSWARAEKNGLVTIGVEPALARRLVGLRSITLPRELEELVQWEACARLVLGADNVEILRAPVSFRVLRLNWALLTDPWSVVYDPLRSGWLCVGEAKHLPRDARALRVLGPDGRMIADEESL